MALGLARNLTATTNLWHGVNLESSHPTRHPEPTDISTHGYTHAHQSRTPRPRIKSARKVTETGGPSLRVHRTSTPLG